MACVSVLFAIEFEVVLPRWLSSLLGGLHLFVHLGMVSFSMCDAELSQKSGDVISCLPMFRITGSSASPDLLALLSQILEAQRSRESFAS